tara:strand:+ start:1059 stop:1271 length:213 start_codon:yes stop_codon:yes gene_type:complete
MRKFKVLVIAHQLKNKVIAKTNDLVDENQLLGNADELVKAGFVEEVKDSKKPVEEIEVKDAKDVKSKAKK